MNWTNEKPKAPGWYWWRDTRFPNYTPKPRKVVDYGMGPEVLHDYTSINAGATWISVHHEHEATGQFAGPIEKPKEPNAME